MKDQASAAATMFVALRSAGASLIYAAAIYVCTLVFGAAIASFFLFQYGVLLIGSVAEATRLVLGFLLLPLYVLTPPGILLWRWFLSLPVVVCIGAWALPQTPGANGRTFQLTFMALITIVACAVNRERYAGSQAARPVPDRANFFGPSWLRWALYGAVGICSVVLFFVPLAVRHVAMRNSKTTFAPASATRPLPAPTTPLATLHRMSLALQKGDADTFMRTLRFGPEEEALRSEFVSVLTEIARFNEALDAKFPAGGDFRGSVGIPLAVPPGLLDRATVSQTGAVAIVNVPQWGTIELVQEADEWKTSPTRFFRTSPEAYSRLLKRSAHAIRAAANDVLAGRATSREHAGKLPLQHYNAGEAH